MTTNWRMGDKIQDRWQIYDIKRGGMGIVYIVYDHQSQQPFAAKTFQEEIFNRNPLLAKRFTEEARAWVNLDIHQNVTRAWFVETIEGKPYLFLEFVSGGDLSGWIRTPRLTEDLPQVLRFAVQFCDGMVHALSKKVIKAHRDIKPANCLVTEDRTLKVTDFGLAKLFDDAGSWEKGDLGGKLEGLSIGHTRTGSGAGTAPYMAPEQFVDAKHVDVKADVYSFGVMLYEMVTGRLPFLGATWGDFERVHRTGLPNTASIEHQPLREIVEKCLKNDAGDRFTGFDKLHDRLAEVYEGLTGSPAPKPASGKELDAFDLNNKGVSLNNLKQHKEALACIEQAISINPRLEVAWSNKGVVLGALGRYKEEITCLDKALDINPSMEKVWLNKGAALVALGRLEEGIVCYEHALKINPRYAMAWVNKGNALAELGQDIKAFGCYDQALKLNPALEQAWHNKGNLLYSLGRHEEALACFEKALTINRHSKESWTGKGDVLNKLGRHKEVITCCNQILAIDPRDAQTLSNKGNALNELFQHAEALDCFDKALEINSQLRDAWYNKGIALHSMGKREKAIACYDRALAINPSDEKALGNKGAAMNELGRNKEAIICYDKALKINPNSAEAWTNKGNALNALNQGKEAILCYNRALDINPQMGNAWNSKGMTLAMLGRSEEAKACFSRALEVNSRDEQAWFNKGVLLAKSGQFAEALKCFEQAQRLGFAQAAQAIANCRQMLGRR